MVKKVFCENCRSDVTYTTRPAHLTGRIKDKEYHYKGLEAICDNCGALVYVPEINDSNLDELYRVRNQVSEDSELIADLMKDFEFDTARKEEVLKKYEI